MGYFGGIALLVIIPVFVKVKVPPPVAEVAAERTWFFAAYGVLFRNVRDIWRVSPNTIWFLLASAIFRDGLAGDAVWSRRWSARRQPGCAAPRRARPAPW
jgi:MFS-type transporter involved in bile tolerance (Atg22 family)